MQTNNVVEALEKRPMLLTAKEVAERLNVSRNQVYTMVARGELPSIRLGRHAVRIIAAEFKKWLEKNRKEMQMGITKQMQMEKAEREANEKKCEECDLSLEDAEHCDLRAVKDCHILWDAYDDPDEEPDEDEIVLKEAERAMEEEEERRDRDKFNLDDYRLNPDVIRGVDYRFCRMTDALERVAAALERIARKK